MIKILFYKEILLRINSKFYLISISIIVILMTLCGIINVKDYQHRNDEFTEIKRKQYELLEYDNENSNNIIKEARKNNSTTNTLCDITFFDQLALLKPSTLNFISNGNDNELPNGITFNYFRINNFENHKTDYSLLDFDNNLDILTLIIMFMSFVVIVLTHDSISGEKYNGTLKLIFSYNVSKSITLFAKYLADIFLIFCPFIIGLFINIFLIILGKNINLGSYEVFRIIFFIFSVFLFLSLQIFTFYLISSLTSIPNFSLLISTFIWIIFVIIVPNTTWIVARIIREVPTKEHIIRTENHLKKQNIDSDCNWGWSSVWKRESPNSKIYNLASCFDKVDELHNNLFIEYRNKLFDQAELAINISSISPYYSFRFLNEKISNSGYFKFKDFYLKLSNHTLIFKEFINSNDKEDQDSYHLIFNHKYLCEAFMSKKNIDKSLIPQFVYDEKITFIELIKLCSKEIIVLLLWLIGVILLLFISFIRYDVR